MSLTVSENPNYTPAPAGLHNAVCVVVADLGTQQTPFGQKPQVLLMWELVEALMDDGRRFTLSRKFTAGLSKKGALRPFVEALRGRPFSADELKAFSLKTVLGKACQVIVQHNLSSDGSRTYANVTSVVPPAKGVTWTPTAELLFYDFDQPDENVKEKLPEWIRKLIDAAIPQPAVTTPVAEGADRDFNDDLKF